LPESAQGCDNSKIWPIVVEVHWTAKLSIPEGFFANSNLTSKEREDVRGQIVQSRLKKHKLMIRQDCHITKWQKLN
jgi:hypothetical protein